MKSVKISKLDAAKRQLETAIRLYFSNGDPVSIHTLTAAAYNILKDLNKQRGMPPMLVKEQLLIYVREKKLKEFKEIINKAENFFKHADRDHEATIDFCPDLSDVFILDACETYYKLSGEFPPLFKLYQGWFMANNEHLFNLPDDLSMSIKLAKSGVIGLGREGYFNNVLPILMRFKT